MGMRSCAGIARRAVLVATSAVVAVAASTALATAALGQQPLDLHHVNWKNVTVPGATCFSTTPIKLTDGMGRGGRHNGHRMTAHTTAMPKYGNLTGARADEAVLEVDCFVGGTAAGQAKFSWVVFSGESGNLRVRGLVVGTHEFRGVHAELLTARIVAGQVRVHEYVYGPADPDCCPRHTAYARWSFKNGKFGLRSTRYVVDNLLMSGNAVGHAALGLTLAQLRARYPHLTGGPLSMPGRSKYHDGAHPHTTWYATLVKGRVVKVSATGAAVTTRGSGRYSSPADVRANYRGFTVRRETVCGKPVLAVHTGHAWSVFALTTQFGSTYVARMNVQADEPAHDRYASC